ncbi:MAG: stage II sporulation protein P [Bacillota bacterium]
MFKRRSERGYYLIQIIFFLLFIVSLYVLGSFISLETLIFERIPVMNQATLFAKSKQDLTDDTKLLLTSMMPMGPVKDYVETHYQVEDSYEDHVRAVVKKVKTAPKENRASIFLYTTHNRESFLPELGHNEPNLAFSEKKNIQSLLPFFKEALENYGFKLYADDNDIQAVLKAENLTYQKSYDVSRRSLTHILAQVPDLAFSFDLHRDSNRRAVTTTKIDGVSHAKFLFVIGQDHEDYQANEAFATRLSEALNHQYPGLSRGVKLLGGSGRNGVYNQDLSPTSILIEVGGVDNSFEECQVALQKLAKTLNDVLD